MMPLSINEYKSRTQALPRGAIFDQIMNQIAAVALALRPAQ